MLIQFLQTFLLPVIVLLPGIGNLRFQSPVFSDHSKHQFRIGLNANLKLESFFQNDKHNFTSDGKNSCMNDLDSTLFTTQQVTFYIIVLISATYVTLVNMHGDMVRYSVNHISVSATN